MFHYTQMGWFGNSLPRDVNGYVPEEGDDWRDMNFDLGSDMDPDRARNRKEKKEIIAYLDAEWWPDFVENAVKATATASKELAVWRRGGRDED